MEQFCEYHIKTKENPKGNDCSAHLIEARCFECPYTAEDIKYKNACNKTGSYISKCPDFEPVQ